MAHHPKPHRRQILGYGLGGFAGAMCLWNTTAAPFDHLTFYAKVGWRALTSAFNGGM